MNLIDIIALAKAGYKKSDIDDLLSIELPPPQSDEKSDDVSRETLSDENLTDNEEVEEVEETEVENTNKENELMEELKKANEKILELQKENINKDISGHKEVDKDKQLEELVRSFM